METKTMTLKELARELAVPGSGTREVIEYLDLDDIQPDPRNFYRLSDIDALADNIALFGLQQPLRVRDDPLDPDKVFLVSGHRRRAALERLVADGREDLRQIPCIREREAGSEALQELRLIYANSDTRRMTGAELDRQAQRVEELLYRLKEEGFDFPGRMRDHVAEACKVSKSKLARLKVIREGLNTEWLTLWEGGKLPEETAYQVARLSEEGQALALVTAKAKPRLEYFYSSTAEQVGKALAKLDEKRPACPWAADAPCPHLDAMKQRTARDDRWYSNPCAGQCCIGCYNLDDCKDFCPHAEPEKERRKKERKKIIAQRKKKAAEADAPLVEINRTMWDRFAKARQAAGKSLEECFSAMAQFFSPHESEVFAGYESGQTKLTGASDTPFRRKLLASDALALCQVADLLGVSLDYLLGRAEAPESSGGTAWRTGTPPRAGTYWTRIESDGTSADIPAEWDPDCGWLLGVRDEDITVTGWVPLPA